MKFEELLPLPFEKVIKNFCILYSPECDHVYGIAEQDQVNDIFEEYQIDEDDLDRLSVESIIWWGLMIDTKRDMLDERKIKKILSDQGFKKKELEK